MPKPVTPTILDVTTRRGRERAREIWTGIKVVDCAPEDLAKARIAGYEPDGAYFIGRDPRGMSQGELQAMGHEPMSPMQAIRAKCLDCCAGSADEARKCVAMTCPSWPFRTGKNPWREVSEARREHGRRLAAQRARKSAGAKQDKGADEETPADVLGATPDLSTPPTTTDKAAATETPEPVSDQPSGSGDAP
jgi:hypothetical protein